MVFPAASGILHISPTPTGGGAVSQTDDIILNVGYCNM